MTRIQHFDNNLDHEVEDLHGADEREAREEPHGASDGGQLVHKLGCSVLESKLEVGHTDIATYLSNPVKGRTVKENSHEVEFTFKFQIFKREMNHHSNVILYLPLKS